MLRTRHERINEADTTSASPSSSPMSRPLHYVVRFSEGERKELELLVSQGRNSARERSEMAVTADWQFITAEARIKLRKLYPTI